MGVYLGFEKRLIYLSNDFCRPASKSVLVSIAVTTPPNKTEYKNGETFDATGMVITATYSSGKTKVVGDYIVVNGDQIAEDMTSVIISYTEKGVTVTTAYEVRFAPSIPVITTSSGGYSSSYMDYAYIKFVDVKGATYKVDSQGGTYDIEASMAAGAPVWVNTFEIPAGTVITCRVESEDSKVTARIKVNGTTVASKSDGKATYAYTVTGNASIILTSKKSGGYGVGTVEITET